MKLKRLPKRVTNEMRKIIDGIKDGTLNHRQDQWHCGTAHCFAGWKVAMDWAKTKRMKLTALAEIDTSEPVIIKGLAQDHPITTFTDGQSTIRYAWKVEEFKYVAEKWGLLLEEGEYLFYVARTLRELEAAVGKFEEGLRIHTYYELTDVAQWTLPSRLEYDERNECWKLKD